MYKKEANCLVFAAERSLTFIYKYLQCPVLNSVGFWSVQTSWSHQRLPSNCFVKQSKPVVGPYNMENMMPY